MRISLAISSNIGAAIEPPLFPFSIKTATEYLRFNLGSIRNQAWTIFSPFIYCPVSALPVLVQPHHHIHQGLLIPVPLIVTFSIRYLILSQISFEKNSLTLVKPYHLKGIIRGIYNGIHYIYSVFYTSIGNCCNHVSYLEGVANAYPLGQ